MDQEQYCFYTHITNIFYSIHDIGLAKFGLTFFFFNLNDGTKHPMFH